MWSSLRFFVDYARGVPYTHSNTRARPSFAHAFGLRRGASSDSRRPLFRDREDAAGADEPLDVEDATPRAPA